MSNIDYRLGYVFLLFALLFAIILDIASFLPAVDFVLDLVGGFVFWIWLKMNGVSMGLESPKNLATGAVALLGEATEFLDWLPLWTLGVFIIFFMVRFEDKTGVAIPSIRKPSKTASSAARKMRRRASYSPEKRRAIVERAQRFRQIREARTASTKV